VRELYPPIEPFNTGFLDVGDGHEVYYEQSGNPEGEPALFLHGGPGGGCGIHTRQFFDPAFYMIVTFDQRGCNRSKPNASEDWAGALVGQDTMTLVEDCEKLRRHLEVESWFVVLGGSWGSTLGIIYSQTHQNAMRHLVLRGVFLFTPPEVDYLFQSGEASAHHPEAWEGFRDHIKNSCEPNSWETERCNLLGAYYRRLACDDEVVRNAAARAFVKYELSISKTHPDQTKLLHVLATPTILVPFALFEAHYMLNNGFLRRGQLLDNAYKMIEVNLPVKIVHGRCDFVCRPNAAWLLKNALDPDSSRGGDVTCEFVNGAGHSDSEPGIIDALVRATDLFRERSASFQGWTHMSSIAEHETGDKR